MSVAHMRRAARSFAISSKKSLCTLKKNDSRGAKSSTSSPRSTAACDVADAVGERERQLLHRRRAGLADVVAADRHRVPARRVLRAELDHVDDDAHRRLRRADPLLLRDELLQHVVLDRAAELLATGTPCSLGDREVHREQHARRAVDRHRRGDLGRAGCRRRASRMSSSVETATPSRPTSPSARGWSAS